MAWLFPRLRNWSYREDVTRPLQSLAGAFAWWFISESRGTNIFKCPAGRRWASHGSKASRERKYCCERPRQRRMRRMQLNLLEITGSDVVCTTRAVCVNETPIFSAPNEARLSERKSTLSCTSRDEKRDALLYPEARRFMNKKIVLWGARS